MPVQAGSRLGNYDILHAIGAGGMGEVFRARDTRLHREVAIKVLPAALAQDPERVARFRREAQVLASLNHPNVAAIYGLEEADGVVALVLELVEGEDLAQRLRNGAIPPDESILLAKQIAEGVEAAHEKGIVHRDLKPANIKLNPEGQIKVLDFGLAKAFDREAGPGSGAADLSHSPTMSRMATEAGVILGTAAYMSPEQARGKALDKRADIWAFGVVLFEMLSGQRLFQGETASDTLAAVLRQDIDWALLPRDLPRAVRRLVERCLEREPRKRLRDIGEARIALEDPRGAEAAPPVPGARFSRRAWLGIATAGLGGFGAGLALGLRTTGAGSGSPEISLTVTPVTGSGNVIEAAISPDGRYVAYVESDQGRQSLWLTQLAGGQTLRLSPDENKSFWGHCFTPDGNSIIYGQRTPDDTEGGIFSISTLGGAPRRLLSGMDSQVTFSPDGRQFAYTRNLYPTAEESALMVAAADGSNPRVLATVRLPERVAGLFFGAPAWSPDGKVIATSVFRAGVQGSEARARLVTVDAATGEMKTFADPGWVMATQSAWLPDGKSLLVIATSPDQTNTQIWGVEYPSGRARRITADLNDHRIISLTRDGRSLVSITGDLSSTIWTMPLRGADRPRRVSRAKFDGAQGIALGPDGELVFTANVGGVWGLWRSRQDGSDRTPLLTTQPGDGLFFSSVGPDGALYYAVRGRAGIEVRATRKDGSATRVLAREARADYVAPTPDGKSVVYSANQSGFPHLFRVAVDGGEPRRISDAVAFSPSVDPEGRRVAFYFFDAESRFRIGVAALEGGPLMVDMLAEPTSASSQLVLRPEGIYLNTMPGDRANVWLLPLDGKSPRRITDYDDQLIFAFAISPDGETLAIARGPRLRDAQLITGF